MAENFYSISRVGNSVNSPNIREFIIRNDSAETLAALPKRGVKGTLESSVSDTLPCDVGSKAFCPSTGNTFMLASNNEWVRIETDTVPYGGMSGVSDYNKLSNLPRINGVVLKGDLSSDDLGIVMVTGSAEQVATVTEILSKVSINSEGNLTFNGNTIVTNSGEKIEYCSDDDINAMF